MAHVFRLAHCFFILALTFSTLVYGASENRATVSSQYTFLPHSDLTARIENATQRAIEEEKALMVVLGAQWCHDSRGLSQRFSEPEMQNILESNYTTLFIDVGFLEDRRAITQQFGYPTYFATPTVFIVDPKTHQLINEDSIPMWGNADSIPLNEYVDYFRDGALRNNINSKQIPVEHAETINRFGNQQAMRLQKAYSILGPMLQADVNGNTPDDFIPLWKEVRSFRTQVQKDLVQLKTQAAQRDILALPIYGPYSWETTKEQE